MLDVTSQNQAEKYRISTELHPFGLGKDFFLPSSELDLDDLSTNSELEDDSTQYEHTLTDEQEQVEEECKMKIVVSFEKISHGSIIPSHSRKNDLPCASKEVNRCQLMLAIDDRSTDDEINDSFFYMKNADCNSISYQQQKREHCEDKPSQ